MNSNFRSSRSEILIPFSENWMHTERVMTPSVKDKVEDKK
jgi:hypothetical protein